jgi:hypothetical protein
VGCFSGTAQDAARNLTSSLNSSINFTGKRDAVTFYFYAESGQEMARAMARAAGSPPIRVVCKALRNGVA